MLMIIESAHTNPVRWDEQDKYWSWVDAGLTEVPNIIPADALEVNLLRNQLEEIPAGSFRQLGVCKELSLKGNKIHTLQIGAWDGLDRLQILGKDLGHLTFLLTLPILNSSEFAVTGPISMI